MHKPVRLAWVPRKQFVEARYENWIQKMVFVKTHGLENAIYMSDLNAVANDEGKLLRDVVICDACNEDVLEESFLMVEKSFCYHKECALRRGYLPLVQREQHSSIEKLPDNVISIRDWLKKEEDNG